MPQFTSETGKAAGSKSKRSPVKIDFNDETAVEDALAGKFGVDIQKFTIKKILTDKIDARRLDRELKMRTELLIRRALAEHMTRSELEDQVEYEDEEKSE